jgi:protein-tyrosine phosphatase
MLDIRPISKILVLCLGNICRSPMAEGFLKRELPDRMIMSAGIGAMTGHPADPFAVKLMQEHGIDISPHRAQNLTDWMVDAADLILTMEAAQTRFIETAYPACKARLMRIGELGEFDVPDPYRQEAEAFRHAQQLIQRGVEDVVANIIRTGPPAV